MIRPKKLDHIVLRTAQVQAMVVFYVEVLGCTLERETGEEQGLVQLRAGESLIDIVAVDSVLGRRGGPAPSPTGNNLDHFCLQIEAMTEQALLDYLRRKNVPCGRFEKRYGAEGFGASLYLQDPDGNTVELRFAKGLHH